MHGPSAEKRARVHASGLFWFSDSDSLSECLEKARFYEPFLQCSNAATESSQSYQLDGEKEGWLFLFPFLCLFPTTGRLKQFAGTK